MRNKYDTTKLITQLSRINWRLTGLEIQGANIHEKIHVLDFKKMEVMARIAEINVAYSKVMSAK